MQRLPGQRAPCNQWHWVVVTESSFKLAYVCVCVCERARMLVRVLSYFKFHWYQQVVCHFTDYVRFLKLYCFTDQSHLRVFCITIKGDTIISLWPVFEGASVLYYSNTLRLFCFTKKVKPLHLYMLILGWYMIISQTNSIRGWCIWTNLRREGVPYMCAALPAAVQKLHNALQKNAAILCKCTSESVTLCDSCGFNRYLWIYVVIYVHVDI